MTSPLDDALIADIFASEGAIPLLWRRASRCSCYTEDSRQPKWGCPLCGGDGVTYDAGQEITGLFRSQGRWLSFRREGELDHGEASLTVPVGCKPGYEDRRVRDRYTVLIALGDDAEGRVFLPAAPPAPFLFADVQRAWRVQMQALAESNRAVPGG